MTVKGLDGCREVAYGDIAVAVSKEVGRRAKPTQRPSQLPTPPSVRVPLPGGSQTSRMRTRPRRPPEARSGALYGDKDESKD